MGLDGAADVLARGVAQVLQDAGIGGSDIGHAFFGLPPTARTARCCRAAGVARRSSATRATPATTTWSAGGPDRSAAQTASTSWLASGSIGYGQRNGIGARGGWGEVFSTKAPPTGSPSGLNAYSRMSDGRAPKGPLHAAFNEALSLREDLDICAHVYGERMRSRAANSWVSRRWWPRPRATATPPRAGDPGPGRSRTGADRRRDPHCIAFRTRRTCARLHLRRRLQRRRTAARLFGDDAAMPPARHSYWCPRCTNHTMALHCTPRSSPGIDFAPFCAASPGVAIGCFCPEATRAGYRRRRQAPAETHRNRIRRQVPRLRLRDTIFGTRCARNPCSLFLRNRAQDWTAPTRSAWKGQ